MTDNDRTDPEPEDCDCIWKEPHDWDCTYNERWVAWHGRQHRNEVEAERVRADSAVRELATARTDALHEAATQVEAYLRKEHAPPTWWHVYDILHTLAGCTWDDEAGEDGWGEYSCVAGASQIAARASVDASFVPVSVESGPRN